MRNVEQRVGVGGGGSGEYRETENASNQRVSNQLVKNQATHRENPFPDGPFKLPMQDERKSTLKSDRPAKSDNRYYVN